MDEASVPQETKRKFSPVIIIAIVGIVVIVGLGILFNKPKKENTVGVKVTSAPKPTVVNKSNVYKNGEYAVVGEYTSPGGAESIDVKVELKDDLIVGVVVKPNAVRPNSKKFQGIFIENYSKFVVGKNIDEVKLDKVSGSSLTPKGFNDALNKTKEQAKV